MIRVILNTSIECENGLLHGEISLSIVHIRPHIEFSRLDDHTKWVRDGQHKHFLADVCCSDWCFSWAHSNATPDSNHHLPTWSHQASQEDNKAQGGQNLRTGQLSRTEIKIYTMSFWLIYFQAESLAQICCALKQCDLATFRVHFSGLGVWQLRSLQWLVSSTCDENREPRQWPAPVGPGHSVATSNFKGLLWMTAYKHLQARSTIPTRH